MHTGEDSRAHDSLSTLIDQNRALLQLVERQAEEMRVMRMEMSVVAKLVDDLRQRTAQLPAESSKDRRHRLEPQAIAMLLDADLDNFPSRKQIAGRLGISESTLRGWTGPGSFEDRFTRARRAVARDRQPATAQELGDFYDGR